MAADNLPLVSLSRRTTEALPLLRSLVASAFVCTAGVTALAVFVPGGPASAAISCADLLGRHVLLASNAVDPDVFIWDTRSRLEDYAAGRWSEAREVLEHTILVHPGTRAVVIECAADAVHPRYSRPPEAALGVRTVSGGRRGRYGWVLAEDVHELAR